MRYTYYIEIEIFLLKVLYIKVKVSRNSAVRSINSIKKCSELMNSSKNKLNNSKNKMNNKISCFFKLEPNAH